MRFPEDAIPKCYAKHCTAQYCTVDLMDTTSLQSRAEYRSRVEYLEYPPIICR